MDNNGERNILGMIHLRALLSLCFLSIISLSSPSFANEGFLPPDQAFQFSAESMNSQEAKLKWSIAPHYYLYHDQFKVTVNNAPIKIDLPKGHEKNDPTFGVTDVHYNQVLATIKVKPNTNYQVFWQGCAEDGLCYPMQRTTIHTDADGLFPQNSNTNKGLLESNRSNNTSFDSNLSAKSSNTTTTSQTNLLNTKKDDKVDLAINLNTDQKVKNSILNPQPVLNNTSEDFSSSGVQMDSAIDSSSISSPITNDTNLSKSAVKGDTTSLQWNDDQSFFKLLSKDSLFFNLFIFFVLGILLAFLPCSLPLIPILSGIIVQRATGYKTIVIALSFVISMAIVYSIMGIVVAEIGYSFQRWFQSPIVVSLFAILFVVLALNLFGLYQLSLPQSLVQKLGNLQDKQKGGTILGAAVMGALSALIVGPCMSAPLAGALLFVSQMHSAFLGGLYLFILGLGIGLPLFIASVFGSRFLPKPGVWMDRLKISFGFVMLMMAVYFIRPMISSVLYSALLAVLCIVLAGYLFKIIRDMVKTSNKVIFVILALISLAAGVWNIKQSISAYQVQHSQTEHLIWTKVSTAEQLQQALEQAKQLHQPIIIDVYADWCVACQPIEKEVFPRTDVQQALKGFTLIKLDLTEYNASQDLILKEREILGPPTMLFLNANAQEIRQLRFTGTFSANQLMQQLNKAAQ